MNIFSAGIKGTIDLVTARMKLRSYLLRDIHCTLQTVVRAIIAFTALGEFIISTLQTQIINVECSIIEQAGSSYLKYSCTIPSDYADSSFSRQSYSNFERIMDKVDLQKINNDTIISGLLLITIIIR